MTFERLRWRWWWLRPQFCDEPQNLLYTLRIARITHENKPLREPLSVVWDKRRLRPRYAHAFCESLAAHMRELFAVTQLSAPPPKRSRGRARLKGTARSTDIADCRYRR
jgi:hypothetical protein